ncbi:MAG: DNA repair protein RecN [Rubellimicrobium sp.]|nr:DNA repair protein RecN [Rubellimicrobium sp.]
MLRQLDIRDLLLIEHLVLDFQPGLNVLTGETGAGKSILLDALGFVLGGRGRADLVRQGAAQGEVTAVFDLAPGHPARAVLAEAGIEAADELILRRVNTPEGRKSAWVNDRRASGEVLRALAGVLVEMHGQQDDRGLLDPRGHRMLLDAFARDGEARDAVRAAWDAWRGVRARLATAEADIARLAQEEDYLRHAVAEFEALAPEADEEPALDAGRRRMQAGRRVRDEIAHAHAALGNDGAEGLLWDAMRRLEGAAGDADGLLDAPLAALARALDALGEAGQGVETALDALDFDPRELERVEERLFALRALARKHGVTPDDLPRTGEALRARLATLDAGEGDLRDLRGAVAQAEAAYAAAAAALAAARAGAAERLAAAMAAELPPLKLDRARFAVAITPAAPGPEGADDIRFEVATNPGAPAGPLDRIASGGELSRFLLALKVCLTADDAGRTLIFDEIDRGVGGATADAVGRRLARLAGGAQVLVVTHSPQVAAQGAHHWHVRKAEAGGMTTTSVIPLDAPGRADEIARMLAGDVITDAARAAARALLAGADGTG